VRGCWGGFKYVVGGILDYLKKILISRKGKT
jgi:hypothetical protein